VSHDRTVRQEFARQAETFAASPELRAPELTERIAGALEGPAARVLDVACGPGVLTPTLLSRARHVVGLDLTAETLRLARSGGASGASFVQGLAHRAPFASESFDAAVLRLALHHFEDPVRALREVRRLLRPGGRVVVLDILTSPDPETERLHNAIERLRDPSHTALVSHEALREQLRAAGFAPIGDECWTLARRYDRWARIIAERSRMDSLEIVLRTLARAGHTAGIDLREEEDGLWFTYTFCLLVAQAS
jgi:SAM-dependent methyltransferase